MGEVNEDLDHRVETVGTAFPGVECKIINPETGEELADGEHGEFVARGYNIMKGYYKVTGRLKDMIIRGGENIYPKEIEEFIYTHPSVKDVQVIGVPDEQYGEEIMACIILKDGESLTDKEMKDYIMSHMAKHKVPKYIDFVDAFPMNAAGKILKYKMREDAVEKLNIKKVEGIVTKD